MGTLMHRTPALLALAALACGARTDHVVRAGDGSAAGAWSPTSLVARGYWNPRDMAHMALTPGSQANVVPRLPDNSGRGPTLSAWNNAGAPVFDPGALGGRGGAFFSSSTMSRLQAPTGTRAEWGSLHNGAGGTLAFVAQPALPVARSTVVSTAGTPTGIGLVVRHDGVADRWVAEVRDETGLLFELVSPPGAAPEEGEYVVVFDYLRGRGPEEATLRVNGVRVAGAGASRSSSASEPSGLLTLGGFSGSNVEFFTGHLGPVVIVDRVLTSDELAAVETRVRDLGSPRALRRIWTVGDSLTNNTYQQYLYLRSLRSPRYSLDFLGTLYLGDIALFTDRSHNGHTAHSIQQIQAATAGVELHVMPTDIVILAGTNNVGSDMATAQAAFDALVTAKRAQFPDVPPERFWIGRIPRHVGAPAESNRAWSAAFSAYQQSYAAARGMNSWNADGRSDADFVDGIHLNPAGQAHQADQLADAMGF